MSSVSITFRYPFNPIYYDEIVSLPSIVTFASVSTNSGGSSATVRFESYWQSIQFSDLVSFEDLRLNNDGNGNLVFEIYQNGTLADSYTLRDFQDGREITGFVAGIQPDGTVPIGGGEGSTITETASDGFTVAYIATGTDFVTFDANVTVTYFLERLEVDGRSFNTRNGVPINGGSGNDTLRGFDINASTGQAQGKPTKIFCAVTLAMIVCSAWLVTTRYLVVTVTTA